MGPSHTVGECDRRIYKSTHGAEGILSLLLEGLLRGGPSRTVQVPCSIKSADLFDTLITGITMVGNDRTHAS